MEDLRFNFKMIRDEAASQVQDDVAAESTIRGDGDIGKAAKPRLDAAAKDLLILGSIAAEDMFSRMIDETKAALTRAFKLSTEDSRQKNSKDIADELLKELQKILEGSLARCDFHNCVHCFFIMVLLVQRELFQMASKNPQRISNILSLSQMSQKLRDYYELISSLTLPHTSEIGTQHARK